MRNHILTIAIAFVVAAPCTARAEDKHKDWIELQSYSHQITQPTSSSTTQNKKSSPTFYRNAAKGSHIPEVVIEMRKTQQTNKPLTTTVNPALQGNMLEKSGAGSPPPKGYDLKANRKM